MLKNLKIGARIALGFAVLMVLLAFVTAMGFVGLREVGAKVAGVRAAKDTSITILEARREEKNFILRGGQDYVDKVKAAVAKLNALVSSLGASGLSSQELANVSVIRDGTTGYDKAFGAYVDGLTRTAEAEKQWKQVGEQLAGDLDPVNKQLGEEYLRVGIDAVYFLKDRSDDSWNIFESSASAFSSALDGWVASGKSGANGKQLQAKTAEYLTNGTDIRALFQELAKLDSAMVDAGRLVIDAAAKLESQLDSQMNSTLAFSILLMLVSAAFALALGILLSVL